MPFAFVPCAAGRARVLTAAIPRCCTGLLGRTRRYKDPDMMLGFAEWQRKFPNPHTKYDKVRPSPHNTASQPQIDQPTACCCTERLTSSRIGLRQRHVAHILVGIGARPNMSRRVSRRCICTSRGHVGVDLTCSVYRSVAVVSTQVWIDGTADMTVRELKDAIDAHYKDAGLHVTMIAGPTLRVQLEKTPDNRAWSTRYLRCPSRAAAFPSRFLCLPLLSRVSCNFTLSFSSLSCYCV